MNNKTRLFICVQLSIGVHFYALSSVCGEVQAQNVRANRKILIDTLGVASRANIDVSRYLKKLTLVPLRVVDENNIRLGQDIRTQMTEMAAQLQNDISTGADWKIYHKRDAALLLVDCESKNDIVYSAFVHRSGRCEIIESETASQDINQKNGRPANRLQAKLHEKKLEADIVQRLFQLTDKNRQKAGETQLALIGANRDTDSLNELCTKYVFDR